MPGRSACDIDADRSSAAGAGRSGPTRSGFIIDRYDRLFFVVSQLQVAVESGLVRKDDVAFPLSWLREKRLCRHKQVLLDYMKENAAPETTDFFASLDVWTRCSSG